MYSYPKISSNEKIALLFEKLRLAPTPSKLTHRFLVKAGLKSSKDRISIPLLKFLNFIDSKGAPTVNYSSIKDLTRFQTVLNELIHIAYGDLFIINPDAPFLKEDVITGYFLSITGESYDMCSQYSHTFTNLCRFAGLHEEKKDINSIKPVKIDEAVTRGQVQLQQTSAKPDNIRASNVENTALVNKPNINISINLPTTTDKNVYEALFKHLKDLLIP